MVVAEEIFFILLPTHTLSFENSPPPWFFFVVPLPERIILSPPAEISAAPMCAGRTGDHVSFAQIAWVGLSPSPWERQAEEDMTN